MTKIPFDIKYRNKIESGEYKVILDCNVEAEILAWDKYGEYPIVCMAKKEGAIPFRTNNNGKAYHFPEGANYSDLFIITPEEELTEFENAFGRAMMEVPDPEEKEEWYPFLKERASELLAIAEKKIAKGHEHDVYIPEDTYYEQLKKQWEEGYDKGKAEAFMELPRWKELPDGIMNQLHLMDKSIIVNHHYILFSDLEKLPGFKED